MDLKPDSGRSSFFSADDLIASELQSEITRLRASGNRMMALLEQKELRISELEWHLERKTEMTEEAARTRAENERLARELKRALELNTFIRRAYEARARENEGDLGGFQAHLAKLDAEPPKAAPVATPAAKPVSKSEADQICEAYELKLSALRAQKAELLRQLQATQVVAARQETEVQWLRTEFRRLTQTSSSSDAPSVNSVARLTRASASETLPEMSNWFTDPGFMPHIHCYLARPALVWTMFITDITIGLAYVVISVTLTVLVRRARIQFSAVVICFGIFILACGVTHFMEVWTLWHPDYWATAYVKIITAVASVATAVYLLRLRQPILAVAEAARESDIQYRALADTVPVLIAYIDANERYRSVNAAYEAWFDLKKPEIIGKTVREVIGANYPAIEKHIKLALTGRQVNFEHEVPNAAGELRLLEGSYLPDLDRAGRVQGFVVSISDVTERKRVEQSLRSYAAYAERNRAQLEAVLMSVNEGIVVFDASGTAVLVNEAEARICGFKSADELKKNLPGFAELFELSSPDGTVLKIEEWPVSQVLQGKSVQDQEVRGRRKDTGQEWYFNFSGNAVFDEERKLTLAVMVTRDITREKEVTRALQEREERFRTYTEAMPQMAFITAPNGDVVYFNRRFYDYVGTEAGYGGEGWKATGVVHPDDLERTMSTWKHSLETGTPYEIEYRLRRHDGEYRWHLGRAVPIRDAQGSIQQWLGSNTDIHDQKEVAREFQEAIEARDEFLSIASHELKTPLASLMLQAQLVKREIARFGIEKLSPERVGKFVEQAERQSTRLARLVEDMLDIARIRSGRLSIQLEPIELGHLVEEVVERLRPAMTQEKTPPELILQDRVQGSWDAFRLEQVVTNLLTNAIRYGDHKPVQITVEKNGTVGRIRVKDQGMGVSPEARERIFNRFERAVSANDISGLGLGLYITREIVAAHGGRIWVESDGKGQGSTFIVELPLDGRIPE